MHNFTLASNFHQYTEQSQTLDSFYVNGWVYAKLYWFKPDDLHGKIDGFRWRFPNKTNPLTHWCFRSGMGVAGMMVIIICLIDVNSYYIDHSPIQSHSIPFHPIPYVLAPVSWHKLTSFALKIFARHWKTNPRWTSESLWGRVQLNVKPGVWISLEARNNAHTVPILLGKTWTKPTFRGFFGNFSLENPSFDVSNIRIFADACPGCQIQGAKVRPRHTGAETGPQIKQTLGDLKLQMLVNVGKSQ